MVNHSMTRYLLTSVLFLTAAVGCTERGTNDPGEPPNVQALAQEKGTDTEKAPEKAPETTDAPKITKRFDKKEVVPLDPDLVEAEFARLGPIELTMHDGPPASDSVEPGRYLLTVIIRLSNGRFIKEQRPCRVKLEGEKVTILLENSGADPITGTLQSGEFFSEPREGPGTYGLEGVVAGPNKIRGMVIPGPVGHPAVDIVEGRWGLDAVP